MRIVQLDEFDALPVLGGTLRWLPIRHELGIDAFGINAYVGHNVGDLVVEDHEDDHQELYVVLTGAAQFRSGEQEFDAPAGSHVVDVISAVLALCGSLWVLARPVRPASLRDCRSDRYIW